MRDYDANRWSLTRILSLLGMALWVLLAIFPFVWTLWGSFKVEADFFSREDWRNTLWGTQTYLQTGYFFTGQGYWGAWIHGALWKSALNTLWVVLATVTCSLSLGSFAAYALSRSRESYVFWVLSAALVFRAMPHISLVSGYLHTFFQYNIWGTLSSSIIVLTAINQPFTLWILYSFYINIPKDLDESALVDGCTPFGAFWWIILPLMRPALITTGLFSFLLAYNDFTITSLLLRQDNLTMVPKIASFLGSTQQEGNVMYAVAAVVSTTAPVLMLTLLCQKRLVEGLTNGAVKR